MNQVPFKLACAHRDELLRLAAERQRASRAAASPELKPSVLSVRRRRRLRRVRRLGAAVRG
jgi:hypothetical protein